MSKLKELASACHNGACNPSGIIRVLGEAIRGEPPGRLSENVELKIIIGQLSYLLGESAGPTAETIEAYEEANKTAQG